MKVIEIEWHDGSRKVIDGVNSIKNVSGELRLIGENENLVGAYQTSAMRGWREVSENAVRSTRLLPQDNS